MIIVLYVTLVVCFIQFLFVLMSNDIDNTIYWQSSEKPENIPNWKDNWVLWIPIIGLVIGLVRFFTGMSEK